MALEANSALPKVTNVKPLFSPESLPFIIQTCWHRPKWHWYKSSQKPLRRLHYIEMELTSVTSPIDPQKSSKSSSEAGKKLTFCIPTIAQMEKKKKKLGEFLLYWIQWSYSAKKITVRYFIYTFAPHSYVKTWRLQIREEMISSLHLQVDLQLTQFLYIISKSSWIFNQIKFTFSIF